MKKALLFAIFAALGIGSVAMAEDRKLDFKYTDGTIEKTVIWEKLCECAGYTRAASDFIGELDMDLGEIYYSTAEDFIYLAKEQLKLDRNIDDDKALTLMDDKIDLEEYGAGEAIEYHRRQITEKTNAPINTNEKLRADIESNYATCRAFADAYIKLTE